MSKVRIHNIVVSLDGFATGEGPTFASPFGHAHDLMNSWFSRARIWRGTQPAAGVRLCSGTGSNGSRSALTSSRSLRLAASPT
jgi:hypothetical protein